MRNQSLLLLLLALLLGAVLTAGQPADAYQWNVYPADSVLKDIKASSSMPVALQLLNEDKTPVVNATVQFKSLDTKRAFVRPHTLVTNEQGFVNSTMYFGYHPSEESASVLIQLMDTSKKPIEPIPGEYRQWQIAGVKGVVYVDAWIQLALVLAGCGITMCGCALLFVYIISRPAGDHAMKSVADPIREGANAFLRVQYLTISIFSLVCAALLFGLYAVRSESEADPKWNRFITATIVVISFLLGCTLSGIAGFIGMMVAVRANVRVAAAATRSYSAAFLVAVRSGAFAGFLVVTMSVLGVGIIFLVLWASLPASVITLEQIAPLIVGFAFGASFSAIFAQLGGGIYTKAADVGADLVGKVQAGIPEDDVRNPAVIADLVGDNVGDCAGRSADLFESLSAENISCMIIAGALASSAAPQISNPVSYILFPLVVHIVGLIGGWAGVLCTRVRDFKASQSIAAANEAEPKAQYLLLHNEDSSAQVNQAGSYGSTGAEGGSPSAAASAAASHVNSTTLEDPTIALGRGFFVAIIITALLFCAVCFWCLHVPEFPNAWWAYLICGLIGIATSAAFVVVTIFYTDYNFLPVKRIVRASLTGSATNIIEGISVGMESTAVPVAIICIALLSSFYLGSFASGIVNAKDQVIGGLFGTAVATVGMLSTSSFVLMMDVFGPISDNAGGIVEMSRQPEGVRIITDKLDACGNTTKAVTKGFAIGSAALASFLLFSAFLETVSTYAGATFDTVNLATVEVFLGALIGACLVFVFSSLAIRAVGKAAQAIISEVRRQFEQNPGIMTFEVKPNYAACVAIVTRSALLQMLLPGALAVAVPVATGFVFRLIGYLTGQPMLGASVTAGLLIVSTITGILMALFLNNAGGAWDNSKKAVELFGEQYGGKGSDTHKAAVVGDTVGDPFKDTAGPSIHVLIKLLASLALVVGPLYINRTTL